MGDHTSSLRSTSSLAPHRFVPYHTLEGAYQRLLRATGASPSTVAYAKIRIGKDGEFSLTELTRRPGLSDTEASQEASIYLDGGFRSFPDSWTFSTGVDEALKSVGSQHHLVGLLDLGCGSAAPFIQTIADHTLDYYIGIDIDLEALAQARLNLKNIGADRYRVSQLDITHSDATEKIREQLVCFPAEITWILGANLPYLPSPTAGILGCSTDGGRRGLDLTPHIPLALAQKLGIDVAVINVSTLCDFEGFLDAVETTSFLVSRFVGTVAPLEEYASKVIEYIRTQKLGHAYNEYHAQIITALVFRQRKGISATQAMTHLERLLATPTLQPLLTVVVGNDSGEIELCFPTGNIHYV